MTDRYERIRDALAMGPTPGPWAAKSYAAPRADNGDIGIINGKGTLVAVAYSNTCTRDNAAHIAACDPDTIAALLRERDALRDALSEAQTRIAAIGYPASPDGEYSKDGEWTFSDAVPRAVDAEEVKAAFLVIRAALADGGAQS